MIPADITRELHLRALRHSLWISVLQTQILGLRDIQAQLMALLAHVDDQMRSDDVDD